MSDPYVSCPYNISHQVSRSRIQAHIAKCQKRSQPLAICPYNATHRMAENLMKNHVLSCSSRNNIISEGRVIDGDKMYDPQTFQNVDDKDEWDD